MKVLYQPFDKIYIHCEMQQYLEMILIINQWLTGLGQIYHSSLQDSEHKLDWVLWYSALIYVVDCPVERFLQRHSEMEFDSLGIKYRIRPDMIFDIIRKWFFFNKIWTSFSFLLLVSHHLYSQNFLVSSENSDDQQAIISHEDRFVFIISWIFVRS